MGSEYVIVINETANKVGLQHGSSQHGPQLQRSHPQQPPQVFLLYVQPGPPHLHLPSPLLLHTLHFPKQSAQHRLCLFEICVLDGFGLADYVARELHRCGYEHNLGVVVAEAEDAGVLAAELQLHGPVLVHLIDEAVVPSVVCFAEHLHVVLLVHGGGQLDLADGGDEVDFEFESEVFDVGLVGRVPAEGKVVVGLHREHEGLGVGFVHFVGLLVLGLFL